MTQTGTEGEGLEKTEAEIWVMCPQTKKYQSLLTKYRKPGKRLGYTLPVPSEGINFAKPWVSDFCLPEGRDDELLLLKNSAHGSLLQQR